MSGPQPSGEPASAPAGAASAAAGDPGNWPGRNPAGGSGHTGGPPSPNKWRRNNSMKYNARPWHQDRADSGPFKNRVWNNYNNRHLPYRQRNNNSNFGSRERQERDYTQRTDYHTNDYHERRERSGEREIDRSPRNPRGRYRDYHHYRDQHPRYQSRWGEENPAKSPNHNDSVSNESNSPSGRDNRNINESIELAEIDPNCETSEASKVDQQKDNSPSKKPKSSKLNLVNKKNLKAKETNANKIKRKNSIIAASKDVSTVAPIDRKLSDSEKNSTVSSEVNQVDGLNKDLGLSAHNISRTSPINDPNKTDSGTIASKDQHRTRVSRWQRAESNLSKSSENISTAEASSSSLNPPRIQVRPLTQLLKQEILAVTQENRLNQSPIGSPTPPAPISSPSRPTFKPILKGRRRTVSNSNQNGGSPSQFAGSEAIINNRIAGMDKESLKYIINNSDTIYDEHLKVQARKRLREEIRRQLKAIELDQPKNNPVTELVEDEIVDAIKLPELLLQEIEKCFGRDFIEGKKVQETEENLDTFKETKGSETEVCEELQASEECSKESATISKDSESIKDSEKSSKSSEPQSDEQALSIGSETNNNQNKVTGESSKNNNQVDAATKIIQDDNISEKDKIKKAEIQALRKQRRDKRKQNKADFKMNRSKDLMSRLKAADEVKKMMAEKRLAKNRGPLLPTPPCGKIPNSLDRPKDQDMGKVQSPKGKSQKALAVGIESGTAALEASPEITAPPNTEVIKEHSTSPIRGGTPNSLDLPKAKDQTTRKTSSPQQTSMNPKNKSTAVVASPDINMKIKREHSPSPIRISPFPKDVIELFSSSEEEDGAENTSVHMDIDEPGEERAIEIKDQVMELAPEPEPETIDDAASYDSASSHCSNESEKRRFKLKLQSDAENVVDSFEKLILPHLRETLSDRYRYQHSVSLQSRLHFISCVVTSSEHNPQTFSKIEVAKIQRNLKAPDNRQGIEFLLREIVSVVNLQKQRRREQEEQVTVNGFSPRKAEQVVRDTPKASPSPSFNQTPPILYNDRRPPILPAHQIENPSPSGSRQSPSGLPTLQNQQPYPVGLPFMSTDSNLYRFSSAGYSQLRNGTDIAEPFGQMGDLLSQNIAEIDRHLMANQNRRSILEEMIMKFQKEKSDLETLSLELQSRKIMLMISSNQQVATAPPAAPRNSPPPASSTQNPNQEENVRQTRSKTRFRRAVYVKVLPKRIKRVPKRATKKRANSEELIAQLHQEIADQEGRTQDQANEGESDPENESSIKEELPDESVCDHIADSLPTVKPKASLLSKPKASVSQQPLAIIPPLPPPPPPPESICHLSDELQPLTDYPELNSQHHVGFIPHGMLLNVMSPITQIRIYREYVIAASEGGEIYMFHLISHKLERQITMHSEAITNMSLCEKDSILYTTSLDGFFKKTSLENLARALQTVYFKEPLQSIDIAWGVAFIGSRWGNIFTYNVATNKQMDMPLLSTGGQSIIALKAAKEGVRKILILGCKGSYIHMNDAANGLLLRRLCVPEGLNVYSLLLSDGHIYCGTQKNQIYQFEFVTGNLVTKLNCGNGAVSIVSYKERYLLAGCYDGFIYVLDKVTGKQVGRFEGVGRLVLALAVAGDKIVTSSKDNSLGILEVPAAMVNAQ